MMKFNSKIAAGTLAGLGLIYMIVSLATGKSAQSHIPPDLDVADAKLGVDVFQAAHLLIEERATVAVVDVRAASDYNLYHLPGSRSEPGAKPDRIAELAGRKKIILIAGKDDAAISLTSAARASAKKSNIFYLKGGARGFYLTFELPVPLFSDTSPPHGYGEAIQTVKAHITGTNGDTKKASAALAVLARLAFEPTALKSTGKPKASGKKRKKIAGGCG
ncbi:MAG: rhodanese-like domain-containing protein [Myxococcota bacterium]|nr:rhodanese-like domain-containing protein [Myxococcota bacterium]